MPLSGPSAPTGPLGVVRIVASPHWPHELVGTWIKPLEADPWFARILRWFRISPFIMWLPAGPICRPVDPLFDARRGILYCSAEQERAIRDAIAAQPPASRLDLYYSGLAL